MRLPFGSISTRASDSPLSFPVARSAVLAALVLSFGASGLSGAGCTDNTTSTTGHPTSSASGGTGTGGAGGGAAAGGPIKILDWNVHDFFDDVKDSSLPLEVVDTTAEYQAHLASVSKIVAPFDPDVAVFAEVENQTVIDALNMKLGGIYPEAHVIEGNDPRGIDIAILSKIPLTSIVSHKADAFTANGTTSPSYHYSRDCVEYHFTKGSQKIIILGVHFKAKAPPDDPQKRLAEGQHTRLIADGLLMADPTVALIVTGDFNDEPGSPAVAAVAGAAPNLFTDAPSFMAPTDAWSYLFQGGHELIDHQMSNPAMLAFLDRTSVTIPHNADVDNASDHSPVVATYNIP
jgi:endonuclease/exonuclease/phosphatase family metal-dependent hydrolase